MKRTAFNLFVYSALTACYPAVMAIALGRALRDFWRNLRFECWIEHRSYVKLMEQEPWQELQRNRRAGGGQ